MAELATLVRKRAAQKRLVTQISAFLDEVDTSLVGTPGAISSKVQLAQIAHKLNVMETKIRDKFDSIQGEIDEIVSDDGVGAEEQERLNFERSFYAAWDRAKKYLDLAAKQVQDRVDNVSVHSLQPARSIASSGAAPPNRAGELVNNENVVKEILEIEQPTNGTLEQNVLEVAPSAQAVVSQPELNLSQNQNLLSSFQGGIQSQIKLPPIPMPKFNGNIDDWLEFKDTFSSLVHDNPGLNQIQKYHFLKSSLSGNALSIIQSLPFTESNYTVAWSVLCSNFDNLENLVHNHIRAIFNIEKIDKPSGTKLKIMLNEVSKHLKALSSLDEPVQYWDTIMLHIMVSKLDYKTFHEWEIFKIAKDTGLEMFKEFLKSRASFLEKLERERPIKGSKPEQKKFETKRVMSTTISSKKSVCTYCKENHYIYYCEKFKSLSVKERQDAAKRLHLCINCLREGHFVKDCKANSCKICKSKHNSLLHFAKESNENKAENDSNNTISVSSNILENSESYCANDYDSYVLLSTAVANASDSSGNAKNVRLLLDGCSQANFISEECCKQLNLPTTKVNVEVKGIGGKTLSISECCELQLTSRVNNYSIRLKCLVTPNIGGRHPSFQFDSHCMQIPANIRLADPDFNTPGPVDVLLGASHYLKLLSQGQIDLGEKCPVLQKTKLGWILSGKLAGVVESSNLAHNVRQTLKVELELKEDLERFWLIEENITSNQIKERDECEIHFKQTTERGEDGRFTVSLPFKGPTNTLGESKTQAIQRFLNLEKKYARDKVMWEKYCEFMSEYLSLGHMSFHSLTENDNEGGYYMPHHGVHRPEATTTKLRTVFDASATTTSGVSLNNLMMIGPTVQDSLFEILIRFRTHKFVIAADIEKMYRQVVVKPNDRKYQKIVWRFNPAEPLSTYKLNTVTYGTAAASFLAIRCLYQLGVDLENKDEKLAEIIKHDFYVDDLLTECNTIEEGQEICVKVLKALDSGKFKLHKWISNEKSIIEHLELESIHDAKSLDLSEQASSNKTLGLMWSFKADILSYKINLELKSESRVTKRIILSVISKLFDPLGLLSPILVTAKLLMQSLWIEGVTWDETVPYQIKNKFLQFIKEAKLLASLSIPRFVFSGVQFELHAFSDASERAYGTCIYILAKHSETKSVNLLCAKGKIAPLKTLTIPKLELCGALLMARMVNIVMQAVKMEFCNITVWCDSTIVLCWLKLQPHLLKIFVGNRIAEMQETTKNFNWRYVKSADNPADLVSRGLDAKNFISRKLWWHGPQWLVKDQTEWPDTNFDNIVTEQKLPEIRERVAICAIVLNKDEVFLLSKYSSVNKAQRVLSYVIRFIENCKRQREARSSGCLKLVELKRALKLLIVMSQRESFENNIEKVKKEYAALSAFLHSDEIIRVGGRISNSNLTFEARHPALLSGKHLLAKLLLERTHIEHLHAGPQLSLAIARQQYWITGGRNLSRKIVNQCINCFRVKPKVQYPLMGNLPAERVQQALPFLTVGVDYAGPFLIKDRKGRGCKLYKAYLVIFVCFSTKALHLELVSDLTSSGFLMTLRRFVSRRGKPNKIMSDNGTNFVGASNILKELSEFLKREWANIELELSNIGIEWLFIPPHSPHMGGLWEAGVRSVKSHLKRVLGELHVTYEEMYSLLVQIEAIVNSRPLCPLSSDPNDLLPLTPSHFLIGRQLTSLPEENLQEVVLGRLDRFQLIQRLQQNFWSRWAKEYVSSLQQRVKWSTEVPNLSLSDLVLVREDNLPPSRWLLGRIIQLHPGMDGKVRVVSIKTAKGEVKRAVAKICPLPKC